MMHKVTVKRQVTLPQRVCDAMSVKPGDYVEIFERDGVAHVVKINNENLAGKFHRLLKDKEFPSSDQIKRTVKKRAAEKLLTNDRD